MRFLQTVLGRVASEQMGLTTTHEHLLWNAMCYAGETPIEGDLTIDMLGQMRQRIHAYRQNAVQTDEREAAEEACAFARAGGRTLIDCTCYGLARDPLAIRRIAEKTGLNIAMGTGVYIAPSHPDWVARMDEAALGDLFTREIELGVGDTGVRAGFIGEIGLSETLPECERKVLGAAGRAQATTGAAVVIHSPGLAMRADEVLDALEARGANLGKVVMGHCDWFWDEIPYLTRILECGANIAFDTFGLETTIAHRYVSPGDGARIRAVRKLCDAGWAEHIVTGQDMCFRAQYLRYGGNGYGHTLANIRPTMRNNGFTEDELNALWRRNPERIFAIDAKED